MMEIKAEKITPYGEDRAKGQQVETMFDNIAPAYDLMNRLMTLGIDRSWRRRVVNLAAQQRGAAAPASATAAPDLAAQQRGAAAPAPASVESLPLSQPSHQRSSARSANSGVEEAPLRLLDVATGTADLAISLAKAAPEAKITGVDLSEGMLAVGREKIAELNGSDSSLNLADRITLRQADCLALPFPDNSFDAVTVAFGVRNFEHLDRGYTEMARVLRPGGKLIVLELSTPTNPLIKPFYWFYTRCIIPLAGRLLSKDTSAYSYLPKSIAAMPQGDRMLQLMTDAGLSSPSLKKLTFGVASIYTAVKPS